VALTDAASRRGALAAFALVACAALLLRAPVADLPFERDEGEYAYLAWRWLEGDVPYRDGFDQKPPGVLAAYALILAGAGASPRAVHWGAQLYTLATLFLLLRLGERVATRRVGVAAALFCALATTAPGTLGNAANVELFALLPLVGAVLAGWRGSESGRGGDALAAGAAAGAALAFKPVVAPLAAFALALLLWRRPHPAALQLRLAAAFALGAAAPWVLLLGYFAAHAALDDLYDATVRFNLAYATSVSFADYPGMLREELPRVLAALGPLFVAAALGPALRALRGAGPAGGRPTAADRRWLLGWLASGLLAVAAGGYFRGHYFQLAVPALSLLAALGLDDALGALAVPARWRPLGLAAAVAAASLAAVSATPWYFLPGDPAAKVRRIYGANPFPESAALGALLAERSQPGDTVFVYGSEPQILVHAKRRSASRYVLAYHYLFGPPEAMRARQQEVLGELRAAPPRFVVGVFLRTSLLEAPDSPTDLRRGLADALREGYQPIAVVEPPRGDEPEPIRTDPGTLRVWGSSELFQRNVPEGLLVVWERSTRPAAETSP
jgi:4-amino-4-deoxy-L-arabinose transferase-like glycosyltransferase